MSKPKPLPPAMLTEDAGQTWHNALPLPEATPPTLPAEGGSYTREPGGAAAAPTAAAAAAAATDKE